MLSIKHDELILAYFPSTTTERPALGITNLMRDVGHFLPGTVVARGDVLATEESNAAEEFGKHTA